MSAAVGLGHALTRDIGALDSESETAVRFYKSSITVLKLLPGQRCFGHPVLKVGHHRDLDRSPLVVNCPSRPSRAS